MNCGLQESHRIPRRHCTTMSLIFLGLIISSAAWAQDSGAEVQTASEPVDRGGEASEIAAIRTTAQAFVDAFNARDAEAIADLWVEGGEYIDDTGRRMVGRDEIRKGYEAFFENDTPVELQMMIDSVRLLNANTAIEDGRALIDPPPAGFPGFSKYTVVHVKVDGAWRMASVRDTHVETPSTFHNVADLEWLIGDWIAEEHGNKLESVCRWVANKSFVERRYTTTAVDGTTTEGIQLIGWNPAEGHVQSWNFSPDGGNSVGIWSPQENGWIAEMHGVSGDGSFTSSVNSLKKLDENAYVWQSVQRTIGDVALPDTDEIIVKRRPISP